MGAANSTSAISVLMAPVNGVSGSMGRAFPHDARRMATRRGEAKRHAPSVAPYPSAQA